MTMKGLYIYGIIPTYYKPEQFRELESINVFNITFGKISAIVSNHKVVDFNNLDTEALARLLIHHQQTIESVMNIGFRTIIPMRLGTFAGNTSEVLQILEKGNDLFIEIMEKISNLVEIDLVSTYADFGQVMSEISTNQEIVTMKENLVKNNMPVTTSDQLKMGYLVKKVLDDKKETYKVKILEALLPFCKTFKQHEVLNDQMISNTAFLIKQNSQDEFEQALNNLDVTFERKINFKLVGPLPCYSFYTMEVKKLLFEDIDAARKHLELNHLTTEKNIKQAYLHKAKAYHPDSDPINGSISMFNRINSAYKTMVDYARVVKPGSADESFSILRETFSENSVLIKIKD